MEKYCIIDCNGGLGKSIIGTAVCEAAKKNYPDRKILVLTGYPAVFLNNPHVYRVLPHSAAPYFYEDYIKDKDVIFLCQEPYKSHGYLAQNQHLIKSWCDCVGIIFQNETPRLYLTPLEIDNARSKFNLPKPMLLIQPFGGATNQGHKYSWNRDIPPHQIQKIANHLQSKYSIVQICHKDQIKLDNVIHYTASNIREIFAVMLFSKNRLFVDSFGQHAAAAMSLPSTVCWVTNKPEVFGYKIHNNILPFASLIKHITKIDGVLAEYDFGGIRLSDYPFPTMDVFNTDNIIQSIYTQL